MDFDRLIGDVSAFDLNLYDLALYADGEIFTHRFAPCANCQNSYSVAKLFVVTALGMLWDEEKLDFDAPLSHYLSVPDDPRWQAATVHHAVTHRLGFDRGFLDIDTEDASQYPTKDYLSIVFSHPLVYEPGTHAQYSDAAFYLLSRLVSAVSGEKLDDFLRTRLLTPMNFREVAFSCCPMGYPIGATGLYIAAGDMVKLPALYMKEGVWQGERLLSREFVKMAMEREYELHPLGGGVVGKGGMYGQMAAFSPQGQFAVAWHAHEDGRKMRALTTYVAQMG